MFVVHTCCVYILRDACVYVHIQLGFPGGSVVSNPPANVGGPGSISGLGRSPGEGNGNLLQCSCLENPMDRGAWWDTVHGVAKSQIPLSMYISQTPVRIQSLRSQGLLPAPV